MAIKTFKDEQNNKHLIDKAGNHFINGKCVNPTVAMGGKIGDTYKHLNYAKR